MEPGLEARSAYSVQVFLPLMAGTRDPGNRGTRRNLRSLDIHSEKGSSQLGSSQRKPEQSQAHIHQGRNKCDLWCFP